MKIPMMTILVRPLLAVLATGSLLWAAGAAAADYRFVTEQFAPFTYESQGKAAGPMTEVVEALCAAIGKSCEITVLPWRRALEMAESGEANGLFSLLRSPEREQSFFLTQPIVRSAYSFIAPAGGGWSYSGPASVRDRQVAVYGPSGTSAVAERIVKEAGGGEIQMEVANDALLKKLALGRLGERTVGFINRDVGQDILNKQKIEGLAFVGDGAQILYGIGLSRKSMTQADADRIDAALAMLKSSGKIREILTRHGLQAAD
jgi:polar amino acid transport system substrate-binding protein